MDEEGVGAHAMADIARELASLPMATLATLLATRTDPPEIEMTICAARIDEFTPILYTMLERAAAGERLNDDDATLVIRGLHVAGVARQASLFPPLLALLRLPGDDLDELLGDVITETLPGILAGTFNGDEHTLFAAITDPLIDDFVRGAMIRAAAFLTWAGRIERWKMRNFLAHCHAGPFAEDGDFLWYDWQVAIALLALREFAPLVKAAQKSKRIPPRIDNPDDFEAMLADAEARPDDVKRFTHECIGYLDDMSLLADWDRHIPDDPPSWSPSPSSSSLWPAQEPVINPHRHIGRNDPCYCGSGKKSKKCCLPG
jgi:hypothetical protein